MVEMAATGAMDFTIADLSSALWWRSLWLKMGAYERTVQRDYYRTQVTNVIKLLCRPKLDDPTALNEIYDKYSEELRQLVWPWHVAATDNDVIQNLTNAWEARWGNPNDQEVQKAIQQTIDALNNAGTRPCII